MSFSRRTLIAGAALVPVAALKSSGQNKPSEHALTPGQLRTLEAFMDRLIPRDENGPGAVDAGAQNYIDRQLAGYLKGEKETFIAGLEAVDAYARRTHGAALADLSAEKRDELLTAIDTNRAEGLPTGRAFFSRARRLTLEGMFGDPYYGGNRNFAGWDLIKYPGPRPAAGPEHQKMSTPATPYHRSAFNSSGGSDARHEH